MPLFSKALPGDVLLSEALPVMALPLAGPSHLLKASIAGYFRSLASPCVSLHLLASHSTLITRCLTLLKIRKWFKNGLKAQKLLAQGIALGIIAISKAPCKGKSLIYCLDF